MASAARDRDRLIGMQPARHCDDHRIGGRRREHRIERRVPGRPGLAHCSLKRYRIDVAHRSEEHTSELQSLMRISYAVLCLKKKIIKMTKIYFIDTINRRST